ncbi:MAG: response regulator, partial [Planctomycetes bacterium]|nr:response regulator [Planctomycetota bacterium]
MDILIVEDELVIAHAMASALEARGHAVRVADSAEMALALPRPQVLITDLQLGGRSGLELLAAYRRQGVQPRTIFVTGNPTLDACREAFRLGACEFLAKPFRLEELIQAVERRQDSPATLFEETYPAEPKSVRVATRELVAFALRCGVGPTCRARLGTAVSEVVQNVVDHAYPAGGGELRLTATIDARDVVVHVRDEGVGFSTELVTAMHLDSPMHDGLARAAALSESLELDSRPGAGASVTLHFGAYHVDYDEADQVDLSELDY